MNGDLREAVTMLAADNARLCGRLIAAEELADAVRRFIEKAGISSNRLEKALEAYDATRPS